MRDVSQFSVTQELLIYIVRRIRLFIVILNIIRFYLGFNSYTCITHVTVKSLVYWVFATIDCLDNGRGLIILKVIFMYGTFSDLILIFAVLSDDLYENDVLLSQSDANIQLMCQ